MALQVGFAVLVVVAEMWVAPAHWEEVEVVRMEVAVEEGVRKGKEVGPFQTVLEEG